MERGAPMVVRIGKASTVECLFEREDACRGPNCGARVLWARTPQGRWMIVDPDPGGNDDAAVEFEPHWASCPDREFFRRRKGADDGG